MNSQVNLTCSSIVPKGFGNKMPKNNVTDLNEILDILVAKTLKELENQLREATDPQEASNILFAMAIKEWEQERKKNATDVEEMSNILVAEEEINTNKSTKCENNNSNILSFFKSITPDIQLLDNKKQRQFKREVLDIIDRLSDD